MTAVALVYLLAPPPHICGRDYTLAPMYSECNLCRHSVDLLSLSLVSFFVDLSLFSLLPHLVLRFLEPHILGNYSSQMASELNPAELKLNLSHH